MTNNQFEFTHNHAIKQFRATVQALNDSGPQLRRMIQEAVAGFNQIGAVYRQAVRELSNSWAVVALLEARRDQQRRERENRLRRHEARMYMRERDGD